MVKKRLHIGHYSLEIFDGQSKMEDDLDWFLKEVQPDITSLSELPGSTQAMFRSVARRRGYRPVYSPGGAQNVAFAIREDIKLLDTTRLYSGPWINNRGNKVPQWLLGMKVRWEGMPLWMYGGHWPSWLERNPKARGPHDKMTRDLVTWANKRYKTEKALVFWGGDINFPDSIQRDAWGVHYSTIMREGGLISAFDALGVATGIDTIGSVKRDKRVKPLRAKRYAKRNSDHRAISVWYEVEVVRPGQPGWDKFDDIKGGTTPNNDDDDPYATGGNVSWKDYRDPTIYGIPQAVDDTDTTNG